MRVTAVLAVALLLSGCTWVRQELSPILPLPVPPAPSKPTVETKPPRKPVPSHIEHPTAPPPVQSVSATPTPPPPPDYSARCHAMADNRADDAKQLGANGADLTKLQQDVYRDCMAQSVKPTQ
jgi:hypothetical protein